MSAPLVAEDPRRELESGSLFAPTSWTTLRRAGTDGEQADAALSLLYRTYWGPICRLVERLGVPVNEAEDLAQNFFLDFFRPETLGRARAECGRFRSYLSGALRRQVASHWRQHYALKRGGGQARVPWQDLCERDQPDPAQTRHILELFDRDWAEALFKRAWAELNAEAGRLGLPDPHLRACLLVDDGLDQVTRAAALGITVICLKTRIHRARARFRALLRGQLAPLVGSEAEIDEELHYLASLLRRQPPGP